MAETIDDAFITQFEGDVHLAFQRKGSKLLNTTRRKNGVNGSTVRFPILGKGAATSKARHADVVAMDLEHTHVEATMEDWYAPEWLDKLDEIKTNIDERMAYAESAAAAIGRKADEIVTDALALTGNSTVHGSTGMNKAKTYDAFIQFGENDVPDDGERYLAVAPESWTNLLDVSEFSNLDYVGPDALPYKGGMTAKRWLGFVVFPFTGLPLASTTRSNFAWHKSAVGCGVGHDISTEINYVPTKVSWLVNSMLSAGSVIIDDEGVREIQATET